MENKNINFILNAQLISLVDAYQFQKFPYLMQLTSFL